MGEEAEVCRAAFAAWLRTGRWPPIERKFNPYHDPRNGQFTFAPGGPRSLSRVVISDRKPRSWVPGEASSAAAIAATGSRRASSGTLTSASFDPSDSVERFIRTGVGRPPPRPAIGGNIRAFWQPTTLERVFPGAGAAPSGAIIAAADTLLDLSGPVRALTMDLTRAVTNRLIEQTQAIDPAYRFVSFGVPETIEGQAAQLKQLRWEQAVTFMRVNSELRLMQVETLRLMQQEADLAYADVVVLLAAGRLPIRLSRQEALGNYVDRQVRRALRRNFNLLGVVSSGKGPVRVNRRESNTAEGSYRQPDARVGAVAFDVTLTAKTARTAQIKGFFATDFQPTQVVIGSTYMIKR